MGMLCTVKRADCCADIDLYVVALGAGSFYGRFTNSYSTLFPYFASCGFRRSFSLLPLLLLCSLSCKVWTRFIILKIPNEIFLWVVLLSLLGLWATGLFFSAAYNPANLSSIIIHMSRVQEVTASVATTTASIYFNLERQIAVTVAFFLLYFCASKGVLRPGLCHLFVVVIALFDLGESTSHSCSFLIQTR